MLIKSVIALVLLQISTECFSGEFCGSKEGYLNQITNSFLIPDSFPPETEALSVLISNADYERCASIGFASLGASCQKHDACYDSQLPKKNCDSELQDGWVKSCRATYRKLTFDHVTCRLACEVFVKLMSEAQRYDSGGTCPSCDAYNESLQ